MKNSLTVLAAIILLSFPSRGQLNEQITQEDLKVHVRYLASDSLEGRASGTEGNRKAANYIARHFEQFGLTPFGDNGSYFQRFEFVSTLRMGASNSMVFTHSALPGDRMTLTVDEDFRPLGFSSNETVRAQVVFAGYGISAPDLQYDDYTGVDVGGRVVIVLRYGPDGSGPHSQFAKHTSFRQKARTARDKGAAGIVFVTGPIDDSDSDELVKLAYDNSFASSGIPALSVRREVVERLFKQRNRDLRSVQDSINSHKSPASFLFNGLSVELTASVEKVMNTTSNVVGLLPGNDPDLREQYVVIGAHFDHLGFGGPGSGSLNPDATEIHNGADDNASGTASLMELAQQFAVNRTSLGRSLVFVAFSGEELGTLGSAHYVQAPPHSLSSTVAMLNMDMVGRLTDRTLTIYGTGTSSQWDELIAKHNVDRSSSTLSGAFTIKPVADGFGPSDHSQFYGKNIPVLFFFTGTHNDYHKPSDDWETLNYAGQEEITHFIYNVAMDINTRREQPVFTTAPASAGSMGGDSRGFSVTLGVIPDYGSEGQGMKIGGVRADGPADKAGLKAGDTITMLAGKIVMNIYDYMGILGSLKHGDEVGVEVLRDGKKERFLVVLQKR